MCKTQSSVSLLHLVSSAYSPIFHVGTSIPVSSLATLVRVCKCQTELVRGDSTVLFLDSRKTLLNFTTKYDPTCHIARLGSKGPLPALPSHKLLLLKNQFFCLLLISLTKSLYMLMTFSDSHVLSILYLIHVLFIN